MEEIRLSQLPCMDGSEASGGVGDGGIRNLDNILPRLGREILKQASSSFTEYDKAGPERPEGATAARRR